MDSVFHNSRDISNSLSYLTCFITSLPEMKSRTQGSRPRTHTQKKSETKAKDQRLTRKCFLIKRFFSGYLKKKSSKKFLLVLELRSRDFNVQAYADDLVVLVATRWCWYALDQRCGRESNKYCCKLGFETRATALQQENWNCTVHSRKESRFGFFVNEWFKT